MSNCGKNPTIVRVSDFVEINVWTTHTSELINHFNLFKYKKCSNRTIILFIQSMSKLCMIIMLFAKNFSC